MTDEEEPFERDAPPATRRPLDRYLPVIAVAMMIGAFIVIPPTFAMAVIGAVWLASTRITPTRRLLGLTLTEALAWSATIFIFDFLIALVLFIASGNLAA